MTALALGYMNGYSSGLTAPAAGEIGRTLENINKKLKLSTQSIASSFSQVFDELQSLAEENTPSNTINATFTIAHRFLEALPQEFPAPELSMDSDGEVAFDWLGKNDRAMTLALRKDGRISYACRISANYKQNGTQTFVDSIPSAVIDCIRQVVAR